jgi:hypothetical protein
MFSLIWYKPWTTNEIKLVAGGIPSGSDAGGAAYIKNIILGTPQPTLSLNAYQLKFILVF